MADVNRGNRPLSPHMTIYRPQISSGMSIFHRITGVGMGFAAILVVWWLLAAAAGPDAYATADGALTSWLGALVLFIASLGFFYHFCNGIRHLAWDAGYGFEIKEMETSGIATLAAAVVLTILFWLIAV